VQELQAELPQLQQQKPRELLPRVSAALATLPSPQLSAFLEAGWRHPSKDAEYVARLDTLLTDLVSAAFDARSSSAIVRRFAAKTETNRGCGRFAEPIRK
jgi:hypothetical protein